MQERLMTSCTDMAAFGRKALAIGVTAALLAGCGLRGPVQMPKEDLFPEAAANSVETAPAESGQGKAEGAAPKPHKAFILDGLLR